MSEARRFEHVSRRASLPFSMTLAAASTIAVPLCMIDFEPPRAAAHDEPVAVALHAARSSSNGMPSCSLSTCANGVAWPMPKSSVPVTSVTVPSALKLMSASSFDGGAVTSRKLPMPRPRSLPRLRLSRLRRAKPLLSASSNACFGQRGEVAAVVGHVGRGLVAAVPAAGFDCAGASASAIDAHFGRRGVDQPLHVIIALGPAGAAIGADRARCW